jgi:hypothetical protein
LWQGQRHHLAMWPNMYKIQWKEKLPSLATRKRFEVQAVCPLWSASGVSARIYINKLATYKKYKHVATHL